jgi:hypothetical protein
LGDEAEVNFKVLVTPASLGELGINPQGEVMEQVGAERSSLISAEILRHRAPYVVLVRNGQLQGIIDRVALAERIARAALH